MAIGSDPHAGRAGHGRIVAKGNQTPSGLYTFTVRLTTEDFFLLIYMFCQSIVLRTDPIL